jgi:hypothetical protein
VNQFPVLSKTDWTGTEETCAMLLAWPVYNHTVETRSITTSVAHIPTLTVSDHAAHQFRNSVINFLPDIFSVTVLESTDELPQQVLQHLSNIPYLAYCQEPTWHEVSASPILKVRASAMLLLLVASRLASSLRHWIHFQWHDASTNFVKLVNRFLELKRRHINTENTQVYSRLVTEGNTQTNLRCRP